MEVTNSESTTSTSYTDLATFGPTSTVTVASSGKVLITMTALMSNSTSYASGYMSFQIDTNTIVTSTLDRTALRMRGDGSDQASVTRTVRNLTPGDHTFTAKYRTSAGTETFANRSIVVIQLP